jgi:hypothetical protein
MKLLFTIIFLLLTIKITAQIDTSVYYPLHIGDKWEYYGTGGYIVEIVGDTLMPNGKKYFEFNENGVYAWLFQRGQNNDSVYYYNTADSTEYVLFDFEIKDKEFWNVPFDNYWGVFETNIDNENLLNISLPYKIFDRVVIDSTSAPPDTIWGYLIDVWPTRITKGLGITSYAYGLEELVGIRINGVSYGTLVRSK